MLSNSSNGSKFQKIVKMLVQCTSVTLIVDQLSITKSKLIFKLLIRISFHMIWQVFLTFRA